MKSIDIKSGAIVTWEDWAPGGYKSVVGVIIKPPRKLQLDYDIQCTILMDDGSIRDWMPITSRMRIL